MGQRHDVGVAPAPLSILTKVGCKPADGLGINDPQIPKVQLVKKDLGFSPGQSVRIRNLINVRQLGKAVASQSGRCRWIGCCHGGTSLAWERQNASTPQAHEKAKAAEANKKAGKCADGDGRLAFVHCFSTVEDDIHKPCRRKSNESQIGDEGGESGAMKKNWNQLLPVDVAIFVEGTYPFLIGGVSSAIHGIIEGLPEVSFGIVHLAWTGAPVGILEYPRPSNLAWIKIIRLGKFIDAFGELANEAYPSARVQHSHTCGLAGLAASFAKEQNPGSRMILSEHSLYVRDVLQALDGAGCNHNPGQDVIAANEIPPIGAGQGTLDEMREAVLATGRHVYENADTMTYLYSGIRMEALQYGADIGRSMIIQNSVDTKRFESVSRQRRPGHGPWQLAMIGRVVPVKGISEAIDCARKLADVGFDFKLNIIGPENEVPCYAALCREKVSLLGLENHVIFKPSMAPEKALEGIDLLLLTSQSEAMPLVVLEAMAAAVPVVAHDVGNVADLLGWGLKDKTINSPAGIIATSGPNQKKPAPAEMAAAIVAALSDDEAYRVMRKAGPVRVNKFFDGNDTFKAWRALYSA